MCSQCHIQTEDEADEASREQHEWANKVNLDSLPLFLWVMRFHEVRMAFLCLFGVHTPSQTKANDGRVRFAQAEKAHDSGGTR